MQQEGARRAGLEEAIGALRAAARMHAGRLAAAATAGDSTDECEWAEALNEETDRGLAELGWTRDALVQAVASTQAARALLDRASVF